MKILQVTAPREAVLLDVPTPEPGPGAVLMRIRAVTTCPQWDLHLRHDEPMFVGHRFPVDAHTISHVLRLSRRDV